MDSFKIDAQDIWDWSSDGFTFTLTPQQRQKILDAIQKWFVEWLIAGQKHELTFDYDPPWDHSGETNSSIISGQERADMLIGTLGEAWMCELTGDWVPTFESGYGKYHRN